jgi:hypothetical protein
MACQATHSGEESPPWTQTDQRVRELLGGADADVVACGHSHAVVQRRVTRNDGKSTLIINTGSLSYGRGSSQASGRADYALLDWSAQAGWQAALQTVTYDAAPLHRALLRLTGDYPIAGFITNRMRPEDATVVPEEAFDFIRFRWGDPPDWWENRDAIAVWRSLRRDGAES